MRVGDIDGLIETAARGYRVSPNAVRGRRRHRELSRARTVIVTVLRHHTKSSFREIGALLDGRSRATARHLHENSEWLLRNDRHFRDVCLRAEVRFLETSEIPQ